MKIFFPVIVLLYSAMASAQEAPVKWEFFSKKIADKTYEIHLTANIDKGWHIYPQSVSADEIAEPTTISFSKNPLLIISGKTKEVGKLVTHHEETLDIDMRYYQTKVDFVQIVKLKANVKTNISGTIEFMACTHERCLPPKTVRFFVPIEKK